jgi:hypothetical protein
VVEVVGEADRDAALRRADERVGEDVRERIRQANVVDRDLERRAGGADPVGERVRDLLRRLTAVVERPDRYAFDFRAALWARFAAW